MYVHKQKQLLMQWAFILVSLNLFLVVAGAKYVLITNNN